VVSRALVAPGTVEFFLDFMSPTAYLAHTQLPALAARTGATILRRTMLTLHLHELTGNRSPMTVRNKARWALADLGRFAQRYGVPLQMNPHFPMTMLDVLHGAYVVQGEGLLETYCDAVFPAVWVDDPEHDEALVATTREAADRGAFGAPTFFVADEMHFGQDRLDFVEAALRG
jgi:2-hydroxychromene-2-carboxylate isomerase